MSRDTSTAQASSDSDDRELASSSSVEESEDASHADGCVGAHSTLIDCETCGTGRFSSANTSAQASLPHTFNLLNELVKSLDITILGMQDNAGSDSTSSPQRSTPAIQVRNMELDLVVPVNNGAIPRAISVPSGVATRTLDNSTDVLEIAHHNNLVRVNYSHSTSPTPSIHRQTSENNRINDNNVSTHADQSSVVFKQFRRSRTTATLSSDQTEDESRSQVSDIKRKTVKETVGGFWQSVRRKFKMKRGHTGDSLCATGSQMSASNSSCSQSNFEDEISLVVPYPSQIRRQANNGSIYRETHEPEVIPHLMLSTNGNTSLEQHLDGNIQLRAHTTVEYMHCIVPGLTKITSCGFYWGVMDRYEAEARLENKPEGTFLLRDSSQEDFLFSVSFRRYGRSLHARIEQWNHYFSFDAHDSGVFKADNVTDLIEHYKDPVTCMFFEPMLTQPLNRPKAFSLQQLARAAVCDRITYDSIDYLPLPSTLQEYLRYYHYKQKLRTRTHSRNSHNLNNGASYS